ncbi:MAG: hypothetical protein A2285_10360 [Elusimicrobia bacterium RIFOXYA12_FULL_57_11]|nr:MAG: hypothetical protein A2285_10360 [Elusimicrobia bacterium RIFOXYA12_FULL_57_11]
MTKTTDTNHSILCLLPALLLLCGCLVNPAIFKKGAFATDDWETWTSWNDAYGSHNVSGAGLAYRLGENQDDTHDIPFDGRSPGLLLSRTLAGRSWRVEVRANLQVPAGGLKRFSFGIWLGSDYTRPSLGSASSVLKLLAQRQNGPSAEDDIFTVSAPPLKNSPVKIPLAAKALRFEKSGSFFTISYSLDNKEFKQVLNAESAEAAAAASQKFIIGGLAEGDPRGALAEFTSLKINNQETLR